MIKAGEETASRRALNMIWNAAGRYHFQPGFSAFFANGSPDDYFNLVIGLADKWIGLDRINRIMDEAAGSRRAEEIRELIWLGVENYVYERELPERPVLSRLRRARAEAFFREQQTLSRQQIMMQSMPVFRQTRHRFAAVTGRTDPPMNERGRQIAEALCLSGSCSAEEAVAALIGFVRHFFHVSAGNGHLRGDAAAAWRRRFALNTLQRKDMLIVRSGGADNHDERNLHLRPGSIFGRGTAEKEDNRAYIRETFGPCLLTDAEMRKMEEKLCTGEDRDVRLWIAKPLSEEQAGKNRSYLREHARMIDGAVRSLSAEIELLLMSFLKSLPEPGRKGRLMPQRAYRLGVVHDPKVFLRDGEEKDNPLSAAILLDASRSRANSQEQIAAETYIIAESLRRNHVPVSVYSFRSLRGYTVLEELKKTDENDCRGVLRYCAGGWNRDALALRTAGELFGGGLHPGAPAGSGQIRVLLVLTDASPNDSASLSLTGKVYEGDPAVLEAADAVKDLRDRGILTAAVFHGAAAHSENVHRIYGKEHVRIRSLMQLSGSAADLLQMVLMEKG